MALESWPESINYLAQRGTFTHKPGDVNIRTDFDSGPSRVRQRFTSVPNVYQFQVLVDSLEKLVIEGFYKNIIHNGADWFSMPTLLGSDYETSSVRVLKDGISFSDAGYDKFVLSLNIEIRDLQSFDAATTYIVGIFGIPTVFDPLQPVVNSLYPSATSGALNARI